MCSTWPKGHNGREVKEILVLLYLDIRILNPSNFQKRNIDPSDNLEVNFSESNLISFVVSTPRQDSDLQNTCGIPAKTSPHLSYI